MTMDIRDFIACLHMEAESIGRNSSQSIFEYYGGDPRFDSVKMKIGAIDFSLKQRSLEFNRYAGMNYSCIVPGRAYSLTSNDFSLRFDAFDVGQDNVFILPNVYRTIYGLHNSYFVTISGIHKTRTTLIDIQRFHRNDIFEADRRSKYRQAFYAYFYTYEARSDELFESAMASNLMLGESIFEKVLKRIE